MELTYIGLSCLRLRGREVEVVIDPLPAGMAKGVKLTPQIVVRTEGTTDPARLRHHDGGPQEVAGPGEYELAGVSVYGLAADGTTVMRVEVDDVRVAALGRLTRQLSATEGDALGHAAGLAVRGGGRRALS